MSQKTTREKVLDIVAEQTYADVTKITDESQLVKDLGADSLDLVEIAMEIEDEFDINIPQDEEKDCRTVADVLKLLEKHRR